MTCRIKRKGASDMEKQFAKELAKELREKFFTEKTTCLLWHEGIIFEHEASGVVPIVDFWFAEELKDAIVIDKVVGKASAMFMSDGEVQFVYGELMSEPSKEILQNASIAFEAEKLVPNIKNRIGDGLCPMESSVLDTNDLKEGTSRILKKMLDFARR